MKWLVLKAWYQWQLRQLHTFDIGLEQSYRWEKKRSAKLRQHLTSKLENLDRDRMRQAIGEIPL